MDTVDQDGFVETFKRTYSYNRTREIAPGDYQLFRPCLFALLSAEKALFGNNFRGWQWVGIVLHFLAVYLALQVMLRMQRLVGSDAQSRGPVEGWFTERFFLGILPYALALFWGMNFAICDIVIFSHISGYVLFVILVLGGLLFLLEYWAKVEASRLSQVMLLAGSWFLLLLSAFTHELGQLFAVAVGLVLAITERGPGRLMRGIALLSLFAGVLLLYQTVNFLDKNAHPGAHRDLDLASVLEQVPTARTIEHASRYVVYTTVQPFFPSCASWSYIQQRLRIEEPGAVWGRYRRGGPIMILSCLVIGAGLLLAARGFCCFLHNANRLLLLLPLALFVSHLALTVFGRMNMRYGPDALRINSYYTYVPLLALVMSLTMICTGIPSAVIRKSSFLVRSLYTVFLGGLVILTLYSGERVCGINVEVKNHLRPLYASTAWLMEFVHRHQHEPDFSFGFDEDSYADMDVEHGMPQAMILFKRHLDNQNPKYLISVRAAKCSAILYEEARRGRSANCGQIFPDLVKIGTVYNIYYFDGFYYGVRGDDGYYDPDRDDYDYLITDRTLEGALCQVPAKLRDQEANHRVRNAGTRGH